MEEVIMIQIENVTKKFGEAVVLDEINMELQPGNIYGLVGKKWFGKNNVNEMYLWFRASQLLVQFM